ncbi:MAG: glycosyltransferase involved in cell wall biosynthesis [Gammaproteobacteria bacterium]|jgi:glycosyltransferase involved in cell wall biosynthesis
MTYPSVTIGVTTYNAEDSIRDALQSVFGQTAPIAQVLVIDDCSTDSTMSVLEEYAGRPGFEVYQNETNSGVAVSRNEIVQRAKGDFIVFFDDDDISDPKRVEAQVERIVEYECEFADGAPVICHTARLQIYPDGGQRLEPTMGQTRGRLAPFGLPVARRALMGEPLKDGYGSCATCSQAGRTEVYREIDGFDARLRRCGDFEFAIRMALAGGHFVGISEPLVTQKMTSTAEKSLDKLKEFILLVLEKHQPIFDDGNSYKFCRAWIALKFDWMAGRRSKFTFGIARLSLRHPILTLKRVCMALPNLAHNRVLNRFFRDI